MGLPVYLLEEEANIMSLHLPASLSIYLSIYLSVYQSM